MLKKFTESLGVRLLGTYAFVAILAISVGVISYTQISRINNILVLDTTKRAEARYLSVRIHVSMLQITDLVDSYMEAETEIARTRLATQINDQTVILGEWLNQMEERVSVAKEEQDMLGVVKSLIGDYLDHTQAVIAAIDAQDEANQQLYYKRFTDTRAQLIETLTAFEDLETSLSFQSQREAKDTVNRALTITIVLVVTTLIGGFLLGFQVSWTIIRPVNRLLEAAQLIAAGNLEQSADVHSRTEIGLLARAFNEMTARLRDLIGTLEQRVVARTKDLATVAEVGTAVATILETDRLLQEVVDLTKERFNLYHSHIYLLDEAGENLALASGAGEPGRQMKAKGLSIPLNREQSLVARAARERKGITVNDVTQSPDFLPNPLLPDTRSELAVPMIVGGKVIGVFDVQSDQVGRFTDSDINIQITLAAQVSTSIQNVRSFEQSKAQADLESMVNAIGQKIQRTTTVDDTLQTAIREIGLALGASRVSANIAARQDGGNALIAIDKTS